LSQLSPAAIEFRGRVSDPARFLETCEGGDLGTPENPSIWVLGIEPDWSIADAAADAKADPQRDAERERYSIELQLKWPYNVKAFKLLAGIAGQSTEDHVAFAETARPFEKGCTGYFKANLFPEPFNNVAEWDDAAIELTGFASKPEYQDWLRDARFAVLREMIAKHRPKVLIGTGLTHLHDFMNITGTTQEPEAQRFEVNGHAKRMHIATSGTVPMAVVPHFTGGSHGLNSEESVRIAAEAIRQALAA